MNPSIPSNLPSPLRYAEIAHDVVYIENGVFIILVLAN